MSTETPEALASSFVSFNANCVTLLGAQTLSSVNNVIFRRVLMWANQHRPLESQLSNPKPKVSQWYQWHWTGDIHNNGEKTVLSFEHTMWVDALSLKVRKIILLHKLNVPWGELCSLLPKCHFKVCACVCICVCVRWPRSRPQQQRQSMVKGF